MDVNLIWKVILIFVVGTLFLRLSGRKTISQTTMPQAVIMFSLGTLLIQPVTSKGLGPTFLVAAILLLTLEVTEYIQVKSDKLETIISGKAVPVIENGHLNIGNLKALKLTVDKLEVRLRQLGVTSINDVETATIETNGVLGYTLKKEKQYATKEDIQNLIQLIQNGAVPSTQAEKENIFTEITNKETSSSTSEYLQ